jgi:hypothetical protein
MPTKIASKARQHRAESSGRRRSHLEARSGHATGGVDSRELLMAAYWQLLQRAWHFFNLHSGSLFLLTRSGPDLRLYLGTVL